ncbi:MAG: hypothetical protein ACJAYX_002102 [Planctomycetota bacterium]
MASARVAIVRAMVKGCMSRSRGSFCRDHNVLGLTYWLPAAGCQPPIAAAQWIAAT